MISDVLADALTKIERYQKDMPDTYAELEGRIAEVKASMRGLLAELDNPIPTEDRLTSEFVQ